MQKKYIAAFDQGTTSTRTIIFNTDGEIVGIGQKELTQHYPKSGWVEHNPIDIYNDQIETFKEAIKKSNINPAELVAVGITN